MRGKAWLCVVALGMLAACPDDAEGRRPRARLDAKPAPAKVARVLGEANEAYARGDYDAALALASKAARSKLLNRDYALYIAGQSAYHAGDRKAALGFFRELAAIGSSRFADEAPWRVADCLFDLGDTAGAAAAYQRALSRYRQGGDAALAYFRLGDHRRVVVEFPAHPLAAEAETLLKSPLTTEERIARAQRLKDDRRWDEALAELEGLPATLPAALRVERDYWIAETLFSKRRQYERAGRLYLGIVDSLDRERAARAAFKGARALSRADLDEEAIGWYRKVVAKYPSTTYAAEAQFLSGWLSFNLGKYREALPGLLGVLERYRRSEWAEEATWYVAFSHIMLKEPAAALPYLEKLAKSSDELVGGQGQYWKARSLQLLGREAEAVAEYRRTVERFSFTWYALLARSRLAELKQPVDPFGGVVVEPSTAPGLGAVDPKLGGDPLIAVADELLAAGMKIEASAELRRGEAAFRKRHGRAAVPVLLDRYQAAEDWNRPWYLATVMGGRAFDAAPRGPARVWWEHAWPLAYRKLVERHREVGKNPPYWLYAIMHKESGFHPLTVSYADAIGLMQMIPPTTRRVAAALGMTYDDDLLFDPDRNIRVASWYIGGLWQKFKGQVPVAAASYNAGPHNMMRWLDTSGRRPMDEFVEHITHSQARGYARRVTGIYARYLYLYEGQVYEQPLTLDPAYIKNDLNY